MKGMIAVGNQVKKRQLLPALKLVTSSTETIYPKLAKEFLKIYGHVELYNFYGSTECSSNAAVHKIASQDLNQMYIPIGEALDNVNLYILDSHHRILPKGAIGELSVTGHCLSLGYLFEEKNNFQVRSQDVNERLYKTGDLARINEHDELILLGRNDNLVKINGFRIELDEIQNALLALSEVIDAVTLLVKAEDYNKVICYAVVRDPNEISESMVIKKLEKSLPKYALPYKVMFIDSIPKLSSGKADKKNLPSPDLTKKNHSIIVHPVNELQQTLVDIWKDVLNIDQVSILDSFFDLGGTSMLSLRCVSELSKAEVRISVSDLYNTRNLEALSELISGRADTDELRAELCHQQLVCTPTVAYLLNTLKVGERYHIHRLWRDLYLNVDLDNLNRALRLVSRDYSILRAFAQSKPDGVELTVSGKFLEITRLDIGDFQSLEAVDFSFHQQFHDFFAFNGHDLLSKLIAIDFSVQSKKSRYYLLVMHHALIDCYSFEMLISEITRYYNALLVGAECYPLYQDVDQVGLWLGKLREKLNKNAFELYHLWGNDLQRIQSIHPAECRDFISFSAKHIHDAVKESRSMNKLNLDQYAITHHQNVSTIIFDKQLTVKMKTFKLDDIEPVDLMLYAIYAGFSGDNDFVFIDNLDMTRMIDIEGFDISTCIGFVVGMFPLFIRINQYHHPIDTLKSISAIRNDKYRSKFLRSLVHLMDMNIPDGFNIAYPSILINNHMTLSDYTGHSFIGLEHSDVWMGESSGVDVHHNIRINMEILDAHLYIDISYQEGFCNENSVRCMADSLISVMEEIESKELAYNQSKGPTTLF
jgi:hypothetical protein